MSGRGGMPGGDPARCLVTGMGIVSAAGGSVDAFRRAVAAGDSGAREAPELAAPRFQPRIAVTIRERPNGRRDPAFSLATRAVEEAAARAGLARGTFPPGSALVVGTTLGGAVRARAWHRDRLEGRPGRRADLLQAPLGAVGEHLARTFGIDGPCIVVSDACASANDAQGIALDLVRSGEAEVVVAGGVDTLHDFNFTGFASLGALTRDRCTPFAPVGRAMLLGEAAAFLVLESEASAARRGIPPRAELAGYGSACDAFHITAPSPGGEGAARAIEAALGDARITADDVDFVALHGVGTPFMDAMEVVVMERIFRSRARAVSAASLRPVTGHTMGAVGAVDTIACILAMEDGLVPPTGTAADGASTLHPPVSLQRRASPARIDVALNTSTGFAGVSSALVLKRTPGRP